MSSTILTDRDREMLEQTPIGRCALAEIGRLEFKLSLAGEREKLLREMLIDAKE